MTGSSSRLRFLSSLRWKLPVALSAFVLICGATCVIAAVIFLNQALIDRASSDLDRTVRGVSGYMDNQNSDLLGIGEMVSSDPKVASDIQNHGALIVHLTHLYADLDADVLDIVDRTGRVVVRMEDTLTFGDSAMSDRGISRALHGTEGVALENDPSGRPAAGGYALRVSVPIRSGGRIVGAVVAGRRLDSVFAARLGRAVDAGVNLIAAGGRTGTTRTDNDGLPATGIPEPVSVLQRLAKGKRSVSTVREDGEPVLSGVIPLRDANGFVVGGVEVVRPLSPVHDVIRNLSLLLVVLGILVVIAGSTFALYVGRRLTHRLLTLEATAFEVAMRAGSDEPLVDLTAAVAVNGNDEVASLSRSFTAMMKALDERLATNTGLYSAAQSRVTELTGLAEIARLLTAARPMEETLDALSELVARLVECSAVAIYVPSHGALSAIHGGCGLPDGFAAVISRVLTSPVDEDAPLASHAAFWTGRPAWRPMEVQVRKYAELSDVVREQGWGAATAVPLRLQDRAIGVLTCYTIAAAPLPDSDLSLLTTIADQVAVAVENARLYSQAHDVAALEERGRLARELHDSVTQALFSMTMQARAAQMMLEKQGLDSESPVGLTLQELGALTQGALAEMRALIFELRPGALREEGLIAALRKQAAALTAREGIKVVVQAPAERLQLDSLVEEQLYRVAQEALHNVVKHARAHTSTVRVAVQPDSETLVVEVSDDGIGFDIGSERPGHMGLGTMGERMTELGGTLEIKSEPGRGCLVRAVVPLAVAQSADAIAS